MTSAGQFGPYPFIDSRGNALPGVDLRVYDPTGTTLASLYVDSARSAPLTNPIPTGVADGVPGVDTAGNAILYADAGEYLMVVRYHGAERYRAPITISADPADANAVLSVNGRSGIVVGLAEDADLDTEVAAREAHEADSTNVHGIVDTAALETQTGAQTKATAARDAAIAAAAALVDDGSGVTDPAAFRAAIGAQVAGTYLVPGDIGSTVQARDAELDAIALLSTTAFGRALLEASNAIALRTAAGLGTAALVDTGTSAANVPTITLADARYVPAHVLPAPSGDATGVTDTAAFVAAIAAITPTRGAVTDAVVASARLSSQPGAYYLLCDQVQFRNLKGVNWDGAGKSATLFNFVGGGTNGLDLNGVAHSVFSNFAVGAADGNVTNLINWHWGDYPIGRSCTKVRFVDIEIGYSGSGTFDNAVAMGTDHGGSAPQVDASLWINCRISGNYPGDNTHFTNGWKLGNGTSGNNYNHLFIGCEGLNLYTEFAVSASGFVCWGGQPYFNQRMLKMSNNGGLHPIGFHGRNDQGTAQLLEIAGGTAVATVHLSDFEWDINVAGAFTLGALGNGAVNLILDALRVNCAGGGAPVISGGSAASVVTTKACLIPQAVDSLFTGPGNQRHTAYTQINASTQKVAYSDTYPVTVVSAVTPDEELLTTGSCTPKRELVVSNAVPHAGSGQLMLVYFTSQRTETITQIVTTAGSVAATSTTIAAGSNGATLPQATINVASTTGFPSSGSIVVATTGGPDVVTYTGVTGTSFTGCSGGTHAMVTGQKVYAASVARVGIYSIDTAGAGTLEASTANDPTLWSTTFTDYTQTLSSSWSKVSGQKYAVGFLIVTGGAVPWLDGVLYPATSVASARNSLSPRLAGALAAQTDLPSSFTNGSLAAYRNRPFARFVP